MPILWGKIVVGKVRLRKVYNCLFENEAEQELLYVHGEDFDGNIIYEYCDGTFQLHKMTKHQLTEKYSRVWISPSKEDL